MSSPFTHPILEEADQDDPVGAATARSIAMTPPPNSPASADCPAYQRDLNRKNIQCHKCNKYGHFARECAEVSLEQKIKELQIQLSRLKHPKQSSVNIVEEPADTNDEDEEEQIPAHLNAYIEAFGSDGDDPAELVNICTDVEQAWFLDSGASSHVTGHKPLLTNIHTSSIPSIRTAGGQIMPVEGQGTISTTTQSGKIKSVHNILYVPGVKTNLLSVGKLTDLGYKVFFDSKRCYIFENEASGEVFLQGIRDPRNKLYRVENNFNYVGLIHSISNSTTLLNTPQPTQQSPTISHNCTNTSGEPPQPKLPPLLELSKSGTSVVVKQSPTTPLPSRDNTSTNQPGKILSNKTSIPHSQILLWHKRICHVNFQSLYHMTNQNLVVGTPRIPLIKHTCSSCMLGKMPRDRIPKV
jgi:hypothetical protein